MVSNSAKLDSRTNQAAHSIWSLYECRFQRYRSDKRRQNRGGVSTSVGSRKKKKKKNKK